LDFNFATTITLGNTAIQLGNTVTTLNNMTLANVTISSGTSNIASTSISNGTSNVTVNSSGGNITLGTAGTTAVTIDTSQNVGIGTTSPNTKLQASAGSNGSGVVNTLRLQNVGTSVGDGAKILFTAGTSTDGAGIASTGVALNSADLRFYSGSSAEAMRIDSSGHVLINATSTSSFSAAAKLSALGVSGEFTAVFRAPDTANYIILSCDNPNGQVGKIQTSGSATSFLTSSDYRLKEDITPMTGALAKVALLKPVTYKWKVDGTDGQGFIAHELQEVIPDCVGGDKDAVDANGNPQYQGIDTSFLVATLTAALQETKALIDTQAETINALTARIVALESK
jgi:hypothetical protein